MSDNQRLKRAGRVLMAGFVVHNGDHARRGLAATSRDRGRSIHGVTGLQIVHSQNFEIRQPVNKGAPA